MQRERSHVSQCKEQLGWIIFCLDAISRVVIPEVEHTAWKNWRISLVLQLDLDLHYNMDTTGIPAEHTQLVFQLECEWRCETESTIFAYSEMRRTFAGLDQVGCVLVWSKVVSPFTCDSLEQKLQNFKLEIACQPAAVIRVGNKKGKNKGHQSIQVIPTSR